MFYDTRKVTCKGGLFWSLANEGLKVKHYFYALSSDLCYCSMQYFKLLWKSQVTKIWLFSTLILMVSWSCLDDYEYDYFPSKKVDNNYKTKHVIVVVADGLRYSEGWGETAKPYMPVMETILKNQGVVNTRFYNLGDTYTSAGHTSITTGFYQSIDNFGLEFPRNPSIFQFWNQTYENLPVKSWVIASKDKLDLLADCANPYWTGKYKPSVNTGIDGLGLGSGYREDSLTLKKSLEILKLHHPNLVLINFRDPDYSAHSGVWSVYVGAIQKSDEHIGRLWNFIQADSVYLNTTTLFVTSDHGRHLDSVADGFIGHGDGCEGCQHLCFYAVGPDFQKGKIVDTERQLIDIPATIAALLGFELPNSSGKVMSELFSRR